MFAVIFSTDYKKGFQFRFPHGMGIDARFATNLEVDMFKRGIFVKNIIESMVMFSCIVQMGSTIGNIEG